MLGRVPLPFAAATRVNCLRADELEFAGKQGRRMDMSVEIKTKLKTREVSRRERAAEQQAVLPRHLELWARVTSTSSFTQIPKARRVVRRHFSEGADTFQLPSVPCCPKDPRCCLQTELPSGNWSMTASSDRGVAHAPSGYCSPPPLGRALLSKWMRLAFVLRALTPHCTAFCFSAWQAQSRGTELDARGLLIRRGLSADGDQLSLWLGKPKTSYSFAFFP